MRVYFFDFAKAASIVAIYFYHLFDFSSGQARVTEMYRQGLLQSAFGDASGLGGCLWGLCQLLFALGDKGVEVFILASGFGLYMSHLSRRTSWGEFYKKRVLRVLPLYWAAALAIYILFPAAPVQLLQNVLLIQTFTSGYLSFGPMWFVAHIFQLYLIFPLLVTVFESRYAKWALFGASFFLTPLLESAISAAGYEPVGVLPTAYLSLFLLGMLLAESFHGEGSFHKIVLNPITATVSVALLCVLLYLVSYRIPFSALSQRVMGMLIFCGLYLPFIVVSRIGALRKPIKLAAYSAYVVFLTHIIIFSKIIALRSSSQGALRQVLDYATAAVSPHEAIRFIVPSLEALLIVFIVAYAIQRAYDSLVDRFQTPIPN